MTRSILGFCGVVFGVLIFGSSWIRYFIIWPDLDKAFFFGLLGLIIIAVTWNYIGRLKLAEEIKHTNKILDNVEQYITDNVEKKNED